MTVEENVSGVHNDPAGDEHVIVSLFKENIGWLTAERGDVHRSIRESSEFVINGHFDKYRAHLLILSSIFHKPCHPFESKRPRGIAINILIKTAAIFSRS